MQQDASTSQRPAQERQTTEGGSSIPRGSKRGGGGSEEAARAAVDLVPAAPNQPCDEEEHPKLPLCPLCRTKWPMWRLCSAPGHINPHEHTPTSLMIPKFSHHLRKNGEIEDAIYIAKQRQDQLIHIFQAPPAVLEVLFPD